MPKAARITRCIAASREPLSPLFESTLAKVPSMGEITGTVTISVIVVTSRLCDSDLLPVPPSPFVGEGGELQANIRNDPGEG